MTFAEKLFSLRKESELSQEELSEKLGVSRQAVSRWEMGTAEPSAQNLLELSKLFGVSVDYLLKDELGENERETPKEEDEKQPNQTQKTAFSSSIPKYDIPKILCILLSVFHGILFLNELGVGFIIVNIAVAPFATWATIVPYIILAFFALLHGVNILGFEIGCRRYKNEPGTKENRRKFYRISVWFFTFSPIILVVSVVWSITDIPAILSVIIAAAMYLIICGAATFLLRKRKAAE